MADLTITAGNVVIVKGTPLRAVAGETLTRGQVLYIDRSEENFLKKARSNVITTAKVAGICLRDAVKYEDVQYAGNNTIVEMGAVFTKGEPYFLSDNATGLIMPSLDLATGNPYVSALGVSQDTNQILLVINNTGVQHA